MFAGLFIKISSLFAKNFRSTAMELGRLKKFYVAMAFLVVIPIHK